MKMSTTRRDFLQSSTGLAVSLPGALKAETPVQVPKMKFGGAEISRLVLGVNPFYGFAHYNRILSTVMKEWYTPANVCDVMHRCSKYGINAFNYVHVERAQQDWERFTAEGGKMHLIPQVGAGVDPGMLVKALKPLALQRQGEVVDKAYHNGEMNTVREWCKQVRDLGVLVGVGTHNPAVIELIEEQGWDVDFYAGCVYYRTRTAEEWKKALGGGILEMQNETYLQSDPPRMYKVIRQTRKPCFAFKVLAAGAIRFRPDAAVAEQKEEGDEDQEERGAR